MSRGIRVLIADDSLFVCQLLTSYLDAEPDLEVVATATNGREALEKVRAFRPDAVTLDLEMPEMDGLEALAQMMRECPTPVVAISGVSGRSAARTMQALDLGAVDFVLKYSPGAGVRPEDLRREILAKVRLASTISVVRSIGRMSEAGTRQSIAPSPPGRFDTAVTTLVSPLIVIGASTGGPLALRELLSGLPPEFPGRILIVQHMPGTFTGVLATHLAKYTPLHTREADAEGDELLPGTVLVAPGGHQLLLHPGFRVVMRSAQGLGVGYCPSIDAAMESAARIYGAGVIGVLLTGMGDDGALGMQAISDAGGVTFAQDADSCVVNGMPQRARDRGIVQHVATPAAIAQLLTREVVRRAAHAQ